MKNKKIEELLKNPDLSETERNFLEKLRDFSLSLVDNTYHSVSIARKIQDVSL